MHSWDKIELRLNQKGFNKIPKDLLMYLAKEDKKGTNRERSHKVVRIDLASNNLLELSTNFFESFSPLKAKSLTTLKANGNNISYVSDKIALLYNLRELKL